MSTVVRPNYGTKGTDNITDLAELEGLLSPFQVEKLTYFFNQFFDFNEDGKIDVSSPLANKFEVNFEIFQETTCLGCKLLYTALQLVLGPTLVSRGAPLPIKPHTS